MFGKLRNSTANNVILQNEDGIPLASKGFVENNFRNQI
jgi:hypothetical protein